MDIDYKTQLLDGKGVMVVEGDLDNEHAGEALRRAFNSLYDAGSRTIVLDLSGVQIINSYGIGKILMCYKRLKAEGGDIGMRRIGEQQYFGSGIQYVYKNILDIIDGCDFTLYGRQ